MFTMNVQLRIDCETINSGQDILHEVLNDIPSLAGYTPSPNKAVALLVWGDVLTARVEFDTEDEARLWWSQLMGFSGLKA
jgi:hypothetical protein